MNSNTLNAVIRHGKALLRAFPDATEKDPVALCRKLRRLENAMNRHATNLCNLPDYQPIWEAEKVKAGKRLLAILGKTNLEHVFFNSDARGYTLKIDDDWTRKYNEIERTKSDCLVLYTDFGGYGVIAPDLTNE